MTKSIKSGSKVQIGLNMFDDLIIRHWFVAAGAK